jgi:hypothetical protein
MRNSVLGLSVVLALFTACPGTGPVGPVVHAIIDCTLENQDQIAAVKAELQPLITGHAPDWPAVYQRAKQAGKSIGGCAIAEVVQNFLSNRSAPPTGQVRQDASDTLEKFRNEEAGGATFKTAAGNL